MLGLALSGGKDSLACWYLYRDKNPIVFWVNTGKAYPETVQVIEKIRAETTEFIEIKTNQNTQNKECGYPSDVVPSDWTDYGFKITGEKPYKLQNYLKCCWFNKGLPLHKAIKERGITTLIRGQRNDETHKSTSKTGNVFDGITYIQPIENWTKEQVLSFLSTQTDLPEHFKINHSSLDCYDCTAFWSHSKDRIQYTKEHHPEFYKEYRIRLELVKSALKQSLEHLPE